ncbi:MAG: hypothetical protein NNA18_10085, partial [Nitrospira sp.]|nr:hypothetical protein [Nitrospira sp.]
YEGSVLPAPADAGADARPGVVPKPDQPVRGNALSPEPHRHRLIPAAAAMCRFSRPSTASRIICAHSARRTDVRRPPSPVVSLCTFIIRQLRLRSPSHGQPSSVTDNRHGSL